jgi:transcriptional regulator with XRE-family HTH domain
MAEFGDRLKQARQKKGWNQEQLAKETGLTQASISQYEKGVRLPPPKIMEQLAESLGVTKDFLAGDEEGAFERKILMRNIDSLSPESIAKINAIAEMMKEAERAKKRGTK